MTPTDQVLGSDRSTLSCEGLDVAFKPTASKGDTRQGIAGDVGCIFAEMFATGTRAWRMRCM